MADVSEILSLKKLPSMPEAMARAVPLLLDPDLNWRSLEEVVKRDEALTTAVLRVANSARFGAPGRQFDLRAAMTRLGRDEVRRCVLSQQVSGIAGGENAAFGLQRGALWRSALGGAIAAEHLAGVHGMRDRAGLAFLCGLLRDIGKLALNVRYGDAYLSAVAGHARDGVSFTDAERSALGFDHAEVGAALARKWKLPEQVARAIEAHHAPPPPGPGHDRLLDVVHAADTVCRWAGLGVGVDGMEYPLVQHVRESLGLDRRAAESQIGMVWDRLREIEDGPAQAETRGAAA
ncbi:MAG: HDOD domain-containing protein [Leptolyngbya sp. PLA1]|nr:HDOD domain-containing protein [Leptolyngbya sp. PLA1]